MQNAIRSACVARLISIFTFVGAAPTAFADWMQIIDKSMPDFPPQQEDTCFPWGYGFAAASSLGYFARGDGEAVDDSWACEVRVQNVAVGYTLQLYKYTPDSMGSRGHVYVEAAVSADGEVALVSGHAAGVAIGYALCECTLLRLLTAELTRSAAATSSGLLGTLEMGVDGASASIPITVSSGHGVFPDTDSDGDTDQGCTNSFKVRFKARAHIELFADEATLPASAGEARGHMQATGGAAFVLGECP